MTKMGKAMGIAHLGEFRGGIHLSVRFYDALRHPGRHVALAGG